MWSQRRIPEVQDVCVSPSRSRVYPGLIQGKSPHITLLRCLGGAVRPKAHTASDDAGSVSPGTA